eukprot:TRINITY_DN16456_c0_g1_i1.p1 TRINITY_DN16456_c0_g1~~TRINITY_DN16456_c0_g1_i1.p1  ORF type:complete len:409 (-),score=68.69 TRINITY_DN16456_c0_g1_i1:174-1400(-)
MRMASPTFLAVLLLGLCGGSGAADANDQAASCGSIPLAEWTSAKHAMKGYHVLCFHDCTQSETCRADGRVELDLYAHGLAKARRVDIRQAAALLDVEEDLISLVGLDNQNRHKRMKAAKEKKHSWKGLFGFYAVPEGSNDTPSKISDVSDLKGMVLVYEGGAFLWPGIEVGFKRDITIRPSGSEALSLTVLTRSLEPLVVEVSSFLQPSECAHVINKALPHVKSSPVSHMDHDVGKPDTNWRSSSQWFMPSDDDVTRRLDARVSALTVAPVKYQEYSQVLRYEKSQRYAAHHDYFDPAMYKSNQQVQQLTIKGMFNRMATVFFYLSNVTRGGETYFPRAGGRAQPANFEDCTQGFSVQPEEGRIIIFYSMHPSGKMDELSLHGGCAVEEGTKWSVNKWIWNKPMSFLS